MRNHAGWSLLACGAVAVCLPLASCAHMQARAVQSPPAVPPAPLAESFDLESPPPLVLSVDLPLPRPELDRAVSEAASGRWGPSGGAPSGGDAPSPGGFERPVPSLAAPASGEVASRITGSLPASEAERPVPALRTPVELRPPERAAVMAGPAAAEEREPSGPGNAAAPESPVAARAAQGASVAAPAAAAPTAGARAAQGTTSAAPSAPRAAAPTVAKQPDSDATDSTVYARPDDELQIVLSGEAWVLLGVQGLTSSGASGGLRFLRRELERDRTVFAFRAERLGDYRASFQRQQLSTGMLDGNHVLVRVVPAAELQGYLAAQGGVSDGASPGAGGTAMTLDERDPAVSRAAADRLYSLGLSKAALEEYRKLAAAGSPDPQVTQRIADLSERLGNQADASAQWSKLLGVAEYRELAVAGTVRTAAILGDGARVESSLDALLGIRAFAVGPELVAVARYAEKAGKNALELTVLEQYLERYPRGELADEVYYRLGGLLEAPWEGRDLKRSRECYELVLEEYPTSAYALASGERSDYLKRHFFYVR